MTTHPERAEDYLEHIAEAIGRATRYVGNLENLEASKRTSWLRTRSCVQLR
jgi:hypothetical protein